MIDPHIFRAYDIRGKADSQITEEACLHIGYAFGQVLCEKYKKEHPTVVVGRDARTHGPRLLEALVQGLLAAGAEVHDIGQTPSPVNYFTICNQQFDGGMQVTASHNPKEDNGIKLQTRGADAFSGDDLQMLRQRIENQGDVPSTIQGSRVPLDGVTPYIQQLAKTFAGAGKRMAVGVDAGNGVAGPAYCRALRAVGCEVIELFTTPDGTFPNHAADPSKHSTLKDLQAVVVKEKLQVGFAFDGDGDRLGVVDENGKIVTADQTLLLLAKDHLSRHPGKPVIFTVSNSGILESEVQAWGGKPVMCKVGHSYVEHAMREHKALLGGEQSGHFFCGEEYFGFDDALVAAMRILSIIQKKSLSSQIAEFPTVYQSPERRPYCSDDKKAEVVRRATEHFQKSYPVVTLDGARIDFGSGAWAGIRYSNTSPCLSICIEARSPEKLSEVESAVLTHVRTYSEIEGL